MKELEIKAMLADPNIPDEYKLGGRLNSRFLDGVEYAERMMEKAPEVWVARDSLGIGGSGTLFMYIQRPICNGGTFSVQGCMCNIPDDMFPGLTFENSPKKVKLIIEN